MQKTYIEAGKSTVLQTAPSYCKTTSLDTHKTPSLDPIDPLSWSHVPHDNYSVLTGLLNLRHSVVKCSEL